MKRLIYLFLLLFATSAFADNTTLNPKAESMVVAKKEMKLMPESYAPVDYHVVKPDSPAYYIANNNYTQGPFNGMFFMSTYRSESSVHKHDDFWAHTFQDGAWNVYGNAGWMYSALPSSGWNAGFGYSGLVWGQTGRSAGFALGGSAMVANIGTAGLSPSSPSNQVMVPINQIVTLPQAYIDYQVNKSWEFLAGNIILNNPFMTTDVAYPTSVSVAPNTYSGIQAQWQPVREATFTVLRTYFYKPIDKSGFNPTTNYELSFQYNPNASIFQNGVDQTTPGAFAAGAQLNPNSASQTDVWFYQFYNYVNLGYADTSYNWQASKLIGLSFSAQGAMQQASGSNIIGQQVVASPVYQSGSPQSNVLGAKLGVTIASWGLTAAYNQFWGSGFGNGGFVSPYTVYNVTDPFYTSSLMAGMVEKASAGSAYKLSANTSFINNSILLTGSYAKYLTSQVSNYPDTAEVDFSIQYVVPNFSSALVFTGEFSYMQQPAILGGDLYSPVLWVSYAY